MKPLACTALLASFAFPFATLAAQEAEKGITVSMFAVALHGNQPKACVLSGAEAKLVSEPFEIPAYELSDPVTVKSRTFFLVAEGTAPEEEPRTFATVTLPDKGRDFRVILIPSTAGKYQPTVIRADGPGFKDGDLFVLNLARQEIVANIGDDSFAMKPGGKHIVRLSGAVDNNYFPVMMGRRIGKTIHPITETRRPILRNNRSYMILYQKNADSITYRGIDEFLPPPELP